MNLFFTVWMVFLIHPTSCGAQNIHTESGFDQVDSIATMAIKEKGIPSLAIGVVKDGHVKIKERNLRLSLTKNKELNSNI